MAVPDMQMLSSLHAPIAVFDAGIGSYAIAERLHQRHPHQDILYFADRASFPYGAKTHAQLLTIVRKTVDTLRSLGAVAVVMASNAPTIVVLDELRDSLPLPVIGVYPPIRRALATTRTGRAAVLGVASLIGSPQFRDYCAREAGPDRTILAFNASPLVELVESGKFLSDPGETQLRISTYLAELLTRHPDLDTFTLSSTHLPWLRAFFEHACPTAHFLDPADEVVEQAGAFLSVGSGTMACLVTESEALPLADFQRMLDRLSIRLRPIRHP